MFNSKFLKVYLIMLMLTGLLFNACSSNTPTTPTNTNTDNFSVSSTSNKSLVDVSSDTLFLDTVKVLIKNIMLNVAGTVNDSVSFKTGPYVLYLALDSKVNVISTGVVPSKVYDKIIFDFHKLETTEPVPDPDFADGNGRYSIVIKGRFNGGSFIFKSDMSTTQKVTFPLAITVSSAYTNVTIAVSPFMWFL